MRYICQICGYIYDDAKEAAPFESLPDSWKCPLCGASKSDFIAEEAAAPSAPELPAEVPALSELSSGQLSALCSNLARGCEKQYKPEESALFRELADCFSSLAPEIEHADTGTLAALLRSDIDLYRSLRAAADQAEDRGAARVCVWGEKVTRMLSSLLTRYLSEGEAMLQDQNVWVCSVCGFVYIGETAPERCPVCRVPASKFEAVEGRPQS